jgi:glutaredoxin
MPIEIRMRTRPWLLVGVAFAVLCASAVGVRALSRERTLLPVDPPRPETRLDTTAAEPDPPSNVPVAETQQRAARILEEPAQAPAAQAPVLDSKPSPLAAPSSQIAPGTSKRAPSSAEIQTAVEATPITMFSTSWCPTCARARAFLRANGLRYAERDIDHDQFALEELRRRSGDTKIPTFDIDGKMLSPGLDQRAFVNALVASVERRLGVTGIRVQFR